MLKALVTLGLLFLMLYANFYSVRRMEEHAMSAFFYQRLCVAYDFAQDQGMHRELAKALAEIRSSQRLAFAKEFAARLENMPDRGKFLRDSLEKEKAAFLQFKFLREVAMNLLLALLLLRILLNRKKNRK